MPFIKASFSDNNVFAVAYTLAINILVFKLPSKRLGFRLFELFYSNHRVMHIHKEEYIQNELWPRYTAGRIHTY